jgi:hypothetical protein
LKVIVGFLPLGLDKIIPLNVIPTTYNHEIATSTLLEKIAKLFKFMISRPGHSRRDLEKFLNNLGPQIYIFNAC